MLLKHKEVFSKKPGCIPNAIHHIQLNNEKPFKAKCYPVAQKHRAAVDGKMKHLMECGVIRPAISSFCSPILVVSKPDGSICICDDLRELNAHTLP